MAKIKLSIGLFELFSSHIAGLPTLLAFFHLFNPVEILKQFFSAGAKSLSLIILVGALIISFILGELIQWISLFSFIILPRLSVKQTYKSTLSKSLNWGRGRDAHY